jgi:hypothetical protein
MTEISVHHWVFGSICRNELVIASEACGGVVATNMYRGTSKYLAMTLDQYISRLTNYEIYENDLNYPTGPKSKETK